MTPALLVVGIYIATTLALAGLWIAAVEVARWHRRRWYR